VVERGKILCILKSGQRGIQIHDSLPSELCKWHLRFCLLSYKLDICNIEFSLSIAKGVPYATSENSVLFYLSRYNSRKIEGYVADAQFVAGHVNPHYAQVKDANEVKGCIKISY
jgi:hypothetical protein